MPDAGFDSAESSELPTYRGELEGDTLHVEPEPEQLTALEDVIARLHSLQSQLHDLQHDLHDEPLPAAVCGRIAETLRRARGSLFLAQAHANIAAHPYRRAVLLPRSDQEETP